MPINIVPINMLPATMDKQEIINAADQCVMCGLCLPHCPTYQLAKNESESPRGRIALVRALYEGQLSASENINSHLDHCLTCMSCERACPANVDYEKIIDAGRAATRKQQSFFKRFQQSFLLLALQNIILRKILKVCIAVSQTLGLTRLLSNIRLINLLPERGIHHANISDSNRKNVNNKIKVAIINSCVGDLVSDQTFSSVNLILSKLDCNVIPQAQAYCCGALHQHTGDLKTAKILRKRFLNSFNNQKLDYLISLTTGCGAQIKRYPELESTELAHETANKLMDVNEFILQQIINNKLEFRALNKKVFLHNPCSQPQVTKEKKTIEQLLELIPEIEVIAFEDEHTCCGAGGVNTLFQEKLAQQLIKNKILELKNNSATFLVSSNIGCALHFQAQLKLENINIKVCHPITLLAQQMV